MLSKLIKATIKEKGPISFAQFMQEALYKPNLGYYNSSLPKFGLNGDFITAPELTSLFGYTLANYILTNQAENLFEFGAGTGKLCVDILTHLEINNSLPKFYYILEVSAHLKQRQQELIKTKIPHLYEKVCWLAHWPSAPFSGVIIANEILDAMPVTRFLKTEDELLESFVELNEKGEFREIFKASNNFKLHEHLKNINFSTTPYLSEVNLFLDSWLQQCWNMLNQGTLIIIDYGFLEEEYYHPDRHMGTLMCHYKHRAHTNPFINVGEQDITAHVDFTHVANAAVEAGFAVASYSNMANFLINNGLLELLGNTGADKYTMEAQAVKKLLQPQEMGELFKVMLLDKAYK